MAINLPTSYQTKMDLPMIHWTKDSALAHLSVLVGRSFFSLIFIISSFSHFNGSMIAFAAKQGVPFAEVLVPISGIMALAGGLSILFGYHARIGALLIILFLIPVTLTMHNFWAITDAAQVQIQQIMFMKNLSMLGASLLILNLGAGSMSFDEKTH